MPILLFLGSIALLFAAILLARTLRFRSRQQAVAPADPPVIDRIAVAERLAGLLRHETITQRDPNKLDRRAFRNLHAYLEECFPQLHAALGREVVSELSLLYTWPGRDASLDPLLFMAHLDVVPVEEPAAWTHPPFAGTVDETFVWGRGALDNKASVGAMMEAIEQLIAEGVRPERTVHLAIGHDEEVGGEDGARQIAARLEQRGVRAACLVDEGGAVTEGAIPGIDRPIAFVGVAEKGYLSVALTAEAEGGHSSMPPDRTAIEAVSRAVVRLMEHPRPARLGGVVGAMLDHLGPEMGWLPRTVLANRWLFAPLITYAFSRRSITNAVLRTTTAPTMLEAGVKDNVIPTAARAVINFRIHPRERLDDVLTHVRQVVDDEAIALETVQASEPTPVAPVEAAPFATLHRTIREVVPGDVIVAPLLVPGATDARHYAAISEHVFRFLPFRLTPADRARIHGPDERIRIDDYATMIAFYRQLFRNMEPGGRFRT